jgi:hypothetical protein
MSRMNPKVLIPLGTIVLSILAVLRIPSFLRGGVSPGTAGIITGVLGTLAVVGMIGGTLEARRKAKQDIRWNH